jgi:signal transduction histidine kinase
MKPSLKLKLTLWYTALMIVVIAVTLGLMSAFSGSLVASDDRRLIQTQLSAFIADVEIEDEKVEIEGSSIRNNVYFSVYSLSGVLITGSVAPQFPQTALRTDTDYEINQEGLTFYVSDRQIVGEDNRTVVVRAVLQAQSSVSVASTLFRLALFALPFLVVIAALVGYLVAYRALKPVERLVRAADAVASSGDLSQRTGLTQRQDEVGRLASSFDRMMDRLQAAFERERRFTADASHELRTPTTVILSQVELAKAHPEDTDEQRLTLDVVERQAKRMSDLIQKLLALSRLDQADHTLDSQTIDLDALIQDHLHDYGWEEHAEGRLRYTPHPHVKVNGDPHLLGQALDNLIQNALKFSPADSVVDVALSLNDSTITLSVTDRGIGMDASVRERVFDRFYQADPSRTSGSGSQGLGLALTQRIVELHHATLSVESTPGLGSRFSIDFKK